MTEDHAKPGSTAAVVVVVALLLVALMCVVGVVFVGGVFFLRVQAPAPMALPPVPGANAPLPSDMLVGGGSTITVNQMTWSQNLFEAADEILTRERYEQLKPGMSYDEAISALGIPEDRRPPDMELVGPQSDVELKWFGGPNDAKSITLKMKGTQIVETAQTGLE